MKRILIVSIAALLFFSLTANAAAAVTISGAGLSIDEKAKIDGLVLERWGQAAIAAAFFVYHDYNNRPYMLVVKCIDRTTEKTLGCLYLESQSLEPLVIIRGEPLHVTSYRSVMKWLDRPDAALERVYYIPRMYPILRLRITGSEADAGTFLLADPERRQLINENVIRRFARRTSPILRNIRKLLRNLPSAASDNETANDGWKEVVLDVVEINTQGYNNYGCGPNAVANVLGYWNDKGCPIFTDLAGNHVPTEKAVTRNIQVLLADLDNYMGTSIEGSTSPFMLDDGTREYLSKKNITGTCTHSVFLYSLYDIKQEIDAGHPCLLAGNLSPLSVFFRHVAAVIGYRVPTTWYGRKYVIVHDSYEKTPNPIEERWFYSLSYPPHFYTICLQCVPPQPSYSLTVQGNYKEKSAEVSEYTSGIDWSASLYNDWQGGSWEGNTFTANWDNVKTDIGHRTGSATITLSKDTKQVLTFTYTEDEVVDDDFYGYAASHLYLEATGIDRTAQSDNKWTYCLSGQSVCDAIKQIEYNSDSPNNWGTGRITQTLQSIVCDDNSQIKLHFTPENETANAHY